MGAKGGRRARTAERPAIAADPSRLMTGRSPSYGCKRIERDRQPCSSGGFRPDLLLMVRDHGERRGEPVRRAEDLLHVIVQSPGSVPPKAGVPAALIGTV